MSNIIHAMLLIINTLFPITILIIIFLGKRIYAWFNKKPRYLLVPIWICLLEIVASTALSTMEFMLYNTSFTPILVVGTLMTLTAEIKFRAKLALSIYRQVMRIGKKLQEQKEEEIISQSIEKPNTQ